MSMIGTIALLVLSIYQQPQSFQIDDRYQFSYAVRLMCRSGIATTPICKQYQLSASPTVTGRVEVVDETVNLYAGKPETKVKEWTGVSNVVVGTRFNGQRYLDSFSVGDTSVRVSSSLSFYSFGYDIPENCGMAPLTLYYSEESTSDGVRSVAFSSVAWAYCASIEFLPLATRQRDFYGPASNQLAYETIIADKDSKVRSADIAYPYRAGNQNPDQSTVYYRAANEDGSRAIVTASAQSSDGSTQAFQDTGTSTLTYHPNGSVQSIVLMIDSGRQVVYEFQADSGKFARTSTQ